MHIKKVVLHRFKQFKDAEIELHAGLSLVVGANNSGKSSILQALATWQFCKTLLEIEKGREAWLQTKTKAGIGMGIVDFTPMQVPSLSHLWTNLKANKEKEADGYTLKIKVFWDTDAGVERFLEMGLSLANDRLFVKTTATNLIRAEILDDKGEPLEGNVPRIGYLPPFAGITDREGRLTLAMRERLIGQGLSGGVIRNVLFDLHETNRKERIRLRGGMTKLRASDLKILRESDPWEILSRTIQSTFSTELKVIPFNERYHSFLKVECVKGAVKDGAFKRFPKYSSRDLMVEGSGFLQWLSVYALALSPDVDVILLDEPDAHLNATLQKDLVGDLARIIDDRSKQVLLATHSPELIRFYDFDKILSVKGTGAKYLNESNGKISVLSGIGSTHTPSLHALMEHKHLLILEAPSDERFLRLLAQSAHIQWPTNLVPWFWTGKASERFQLYTQLLREIPGLTAISIRDRDDEADGSVTATLLDKAFTSKDLGFKAMKWRRRHIENYLLCTSAIARAADRPEADVNAFFKDHALVLPDDTTPSDVPLPIRDAHGKELATGPKSLASTFHITRETIAKNMSKDEIAADLITFFDALTELCAPKK